MARTDAVAAFLDTNVLVRTFDDAAPVERDAARELVGRVLGDGTGAISFQVVQEFLDVATRRFAAPMTEAQASAYLAGVLAKLCTVYASIPLYERALGIRERWRFSWHDALIVAGALESGASVLYSEDLRHGQRIETLTVANPFADGHAIHDG